MFPLLYFSPLGLRVLWSIGILAQLIPRFERVCVTSTYFKNGLKEQHCLSEFSRMSSHWLNSKSHIWNQNTRLFTYSEIKHQETNTCSPLVQALSSYRHINYSENQVVTMKQVGKHRLKTSKVSFMRWMLNSIRVKLQNISLSAIRSLEQMYQILGCVLTLSGTVSLRKWF